MCFCLIIKIKVCSDRLLKCCFVLVLIADKEDIRLLVKGVIFGVLGQQMDCLALDTP